jgi:type IV fimbrial biogenesis protein FimT
MRADSSKNINPFVCLFRPSVCYKNTPVYPLIGYKIPFVCNRGFSLIEVIVVLTIAAILLTIAGPALQKFVASNRLTAQVNDLMADINLARSEAIKRNTASGLCASTSGTSCTTGGNWANGWLVYYNNSGTNVVLKVHESLTGNNSLSAIQTDVSSSTTASVDTVAYGKSGAFASQAFTYQFTVCDPKRGQSRIIDISVLGQTSVSSSTC